MRPFGSPYIEDDMDDEEPIVPKAEPAADPASTNRTNPAAPSEKTDLPARATRTHVTAAAHHPSRAIEQTPPVSVRPASTFADKGASADGEAQGISALQRDLELQLEELKAEELLALARKNRIAMERRFI